MKRLWIYIIFILTYVLLHTLTMFVIMAHESSTLETINNVEKVAMFIHMYVLKFPIGMWSWFGEKHFSNPFVLIPNALIMCKLFIIWRKK